MHSPPPFLIKDKKDEGPKTGIPKRFLILCLVIFLLAGVIFTWPLAGNFFSSIPYTLRPIPGFERVPLIPGDHLQTYYWFWLLSDNLFGHSALFTNPYEFNGPLGPMSAVYANFPFSLLYIALLPLGTVGAYNSLILLSFILSGWAMLLLAWTWTKDPWASLLAGLVFAVVPYRVSHIAGGQLFGHVIFLLPLFLYFVEMTLEKGRWFYGGAAGLSLILLSLMDPHTSYLTALTIGIYLPSRIILTQPLTEKPGQDQKPLWPELAGVLSGGLSIGFFLWVWLGKKTGLPFWHRDLLQPVILGTLATFLFWFYLSALFSRLTRLTFAEARHRIGKTFFLFLPLWFYVIKYRPDIPRLGLILPLVCLSLFSAFLIILGIKRRNQFPVVNRTPILIVTAWVGMGLAVASAYLMHIRTTVFLPSLAGKGRTINEVLLFSPKAGNFFFWQDINYERFVILGWGLVILALLGLVPLFRGNPNDSGKRALAGILAFLALVLTLGPTLSHFPLYQTLHTYFPFFKYPRAPARFVMVGLIFLCLLAGLALSGLRKWLVSKGWIRAGKWVPFLILLFVLAEYHTCRPLGLSLMTGPTRIYEEIRNRLANGRRVLELPIWPGDSHQSSAYEYTVTRTRRPMINGYAPVVFRDYIQQVFWPLYPLGHGEMNTAQVQELKRLKVDLITFHDNALIYTEKVSPFPPRLALTRLLASPRLKLLAQDKEVFLFQLDDKGAPSSNQPVRTSPVQAVFYSFNQPQETGRHQFDPSASGFFLLMDEQGLAKGKLVPTPRTQGNVVSAIPGRDQPGYLIHGPHRFFPSGTYRARFRIKAGSVDPQVEVGRIELIEDRIKIISQKTIRGRDSLPSQAWVDIPLEFEIPRAKEIGFRVYFSGKAPLSFNLAVIGFSGQNPGPGPVEAEDLLRQTGTVVFDPLASGKEAVLGQAGYHPPIYLCYGPYQTLEPGLYQADFFIRLKDRPVVPKQAEGVLLEVATDMGRRILNSRRVRVEELSTDGYRPVRVDFKVPFRCELGYRVKFLNQTDLLIDRVEVVSSGNKVR